LSWGAITNATSAIIDHEIGSIPRPGGIKSVNPTTTTTYTLTAAGCDGITTKQVTVTVHPAAAPFSGTWLNDDPNPRDPWPFITRLIITNSGQNLTVQEYSKFTSTSTEWDWGKQSGTFNGEPFELKLPYPFTLQLSLTLISPGSARLVGGGTQLRAVAHCLPPGSANHCVDATSTFHREQPPLQIKP
jgi:hypothetical protein